MAKWSKLRKDLEKVVDLNLVDIKCSVYPMRSQRGSTDIPRYFIQHQKEIVFDFPKDFVNQKFKYYDKDYILKDIYPHFPMVEKVSDLLRNYVNSSLEKTEDLEDELGLREFLWAGDKRIGKRRYKDYLKKMNNSKAKDILKSRFES